MWWQEVGVNKARVCKRWEVRRGTREPRFLSPKFTRYRSPPQ